MTDLQDGAWGIPGWTAQNLAYPPDSPPAGAPALPFVTASGHYRDGDGRNLQARVVAIPSVPVVQQDGYQYYLDTHNVESIRGDVSIQLPIGSWTWTIRQRIGPKTYVNTGVNPSGDFDLASLPHIEGVDGGGPDGTFGGGGPDEPDGVNVAVLDGGTL